MSKITNYKSLKYLQYTLAILLSLTNSNINSAAIISDNSSNTRQNQLDLIDAATKNNVQQLEELINAGVDINAVDEDKLTALMHTCMHDHIDCAQLLINAGADVNAVHDDSGHTPLIIAAFNKSIKLVGLLIKSHANLNIHEKCEPKWTALAFAVWNSQKKITELLLKAGAIIDYKLDLAKGETRQLVQNEQSRRYNTVEKWLEINKNNKAPILIQTSKKIAEATDLIQDISKTITEYLIEYTDLPLADRLAS